VNFGRPSATAVINAASALLAQRSSAAPVVAWQGLHESLADFDKRMAAIRGRASVLAVQSGRRHTAPVQGVTHVQLPPKLFDLLHPARTERYVIATGGRGSGKSFAFATAFVLRALSGPGRALLCREILKSIRESQHRLIADRIEALGLSRNFDIKEHSITCLPTGYDFLFEGLYSNLTKILSLEGITEAWIEQSESVSADSLEKLGPTLRAEGSRLYLTANPTDPDAPFERLLERPDCRQVHVTYADNEWFPNALRLEMEYLRSAALDLFEHIWLGRHRIISSLSIFGDKVAVEAFEPRPEWSGPHIGLDFGHTDPTAAVECWVNDDCVYIARELWQVKLDIDALPGALTAAIPSAAHHVVRCDTHRPDSIEYLKGHGIPNAIAAKKGANSVSDGIAGLRAFRKLIVHERCTHALEEFRGYQWKADRLSGDPLPEPRAGAEHTCDAARYALEPVLKQTQPGILTWLLEASAHAAAPVAHVERPGVTVTTLTATGNH
jgi:phage terminase large subunit